MSDNNKPLLIIDGYGFVFRAYHVQPPLTSPAGFPVGAIYGLTSMLIKLIGDFKPENAVMVLDHGGPNFRHQICDSYKAHRPPAPEDLVAQLAMVRTAASAMNFPILEKQGFEADDIIATLAKKATEQQKEAIIISADKDLMQLINEHVKLYDPTKAKYTSVDNVIEKFGVGPNEVREVQALMGDKSDNIPGIPGFGPKTAAQLIKQFHNIHNLIENIDQVSNKRQQELITKHREDALISWQLVGLDENVELDATINDLNWQAPDVDKISAFLHECGFKSLYKRVENLFKLKINEEVPTIRNIVSKSEIVTIKNELQYADFISEVEKLGMVACNLVGEKAGNDYNLVFSTSAPNHRSNKIYSINYKSEPENNDKNYKSDLFSYAEKTPSLDSISFNKQIESLFANPALLKIGFNLKKWLKILKGVAFEDLELMDYCLTAGNKSKSIGEIILHYKIDQNRQLLPHSLEMVEDFIDTYLALKSSLQKCKILHLYDSIDLPICHILNDMEKAGVKIDPNRLNTLSHEFVLKLHDLEKQIFTITSKEFNIASPKQLGEILFEELKLPFGKISGKSKSYSTGSDILDKLSEEGFEIADLLLEHRHLSKLKNTYTDSLPNQINAATGRVHTTFLQNSTSTGRFSSKDPNVQNIPTRTEEGKKIRSAFVSPEGYKLISADYSQIELRILSHVANVASLKEAFIHNQDIHKKTASQIFGIKIENVTSDLRYKAKAINFGIIYGISAFGLGKQLNIPTKEAGEYIERYFKEYPEIKNYMEKTIAFAKEHGYVENLLSRKCFLPLINDKNHALRSFAQRAAINAPMQSLAADIVKIAMIKVDKMLKQEAANNGQKQTRMIMQIHDELIFESPNSELDTIMPIIKNIMQNAFILDIPLTVDIDAGQNWQEI